MEKIMHIAAQYLATAAISFIAKKEDDSHTNLGWTSNGLETHPFLNGDSLGLNYKHFSLEWCHSNGSKEELPLDNKTHKEVVNWITEMTGNTDLDKSYAYQLHYELPYSSITDEYRFEISNQNELDLLKERRNLAQMAISKVLKGNNYESAIRIWPHHFDTGAFVTVDEKLSIGLGMAMPDTLINDFYLYVSGYNGHQPIAIEPTNNIDKALYYSNGWQGFAIAVGEIDSDSAIDFYQKAINEYLNSMT